MVRNQHHIQNIDYCQIKTEFGPVYVAIGRGPTSDPEMGIMTWQGAYAVIYGGGHFLGRTGEVSSNASKEEALQHFVNDARNLYAMMAYREMNDESFKLNG